MLSTRIGDHIRGNVVGYLAIFLFAIGGTANATHPGGQNTISTADIIDGQVKTGDLGNGEVKVADVGQAAVATDEIANGQVKAADIGDGEVRSAEIGDGEVRSVEIANGQVLSADVADDNLTGGDVAPNSLKGADIDESTLTNIGGGGPAGGDLTGTYPNPQIAPDAVTGAEVAPDTLTAEDLGNNIIGSEEVVDNELEGVDINESTLGQTPSALIGGFGRGGSEGSCDPESATFVTCASVNLTVPASGARALLVGRVVGYAEGGADTGEGLCRLGTSTVGVVPNTTVFVDADRADVFPTPAYAPLIGVTPALPAGANSFGIDCNQDLTDGAVEYQDAVISAVLIAPS